MTSSLSKLSDECHEETAIMSSHSYGSMVIAKLKALQLILAYSSESSLEGRLVITGAHRKNRLLCKFRVEKYQPFFCHPWDRVTRDTALKVMINMYNVDHNAIKDSKRCSCEYTVYH